MKKIILIFALLIGAGSYHSVSNAQKININININIGNQPDWGPIGYDYVDYYYFPDINCYYDVNQLRFIYMHNGRWVQSRYLPYRYERYDLYNMYKVILVDIRTPWIFNTRHRRQYVSYVGHRPQHVIRDSRDNRYTSSRRNTIAWRAPANARRDQYDRVLPGRNSVSGRDNTRPSTTTNGRNNTRENTREVTNTTQRSEQGNRITTTSRERNTSQSTSRSQSVDQNRNNTKSTQASSQRSTSNNRGVSRQ